MKNGTGIRSFIAAGALALAATLGACGSTTVVAPVKHPVAVTKPTTVVAPTPTTVAAPTVKSWSEANYRLVMSMAYVTTVVGYAAQDAPLGTAPMFCSELQGDVVQARTLPPVPDAQLNAQWQAFVNNSASVAQDCIEGVVHENASDINQMASILPTTQSEGSAFSLIVENNIGLATPKAGA